MVAAVCCWSLVGLALMYSSGMFPGATRLAVVGRLVQKLALPVSQDNRRPDGQTDTRDRADLAQDAQQQLRAMAGHHPAVDAILHSLIPLARNRAAQKRYALGAERAWVAIIHGPAGVGKSMMAAVLADLLIGLNAAAKPLRVPIPAPTPGRFESNWDEILERGVDGVVLLDNARWLADTNPLTQTHQSEDFLATVNAFAERYPGRLCLIITLTTEQREQAFASETARDLMRRLTVVDLVCEALDEPSLMQIFQTYLAKHDLTVESNAEPNVLRLIRRQRDFAGRKFDHAEAVRRIAESLSMRLAELGRDRVTARDVVEVGNILEQDS
jgi:hypothetical protein